MNIGNLVTNLTTTCNFHLNHQRPYRLYWLLLKSQGTHIHTNAALQPCCIIHSYKKTKNKNKTIIMRDLFWEQDPSWMRFHNFPCNEQLKWIQYHWLAINNVCVTTTNRGYGAKGHCQSWVCSFFSQMSCRSEKWNTCIASSKVFQLIQIKTQTWQRPMWF